MDRAGKSALYPRAMGDPTAIARQNALERIEADAWESLCRAAPRPLASALGLEVHRFGEALMTLCARIDQGQFNRLFGLGLEEGGEAGTIAEAAARFKAAGLRNPFIQIPPGHSELETASQAAGLCLHKRPWVKFQRGPGDVPRPVTGVEIAPVSLKNAGLFGSVIAAGFGMPPALADWLAGLVERSGWQCYLAWDGDVAIGGAALYLKDEAAWLGAGASRPDARRRGAQSALLARRIADASHAGATLITTETGKPLPGEDHPSYRNIARSGFTIAYERTNWTFAS